MIRVLFSHLPKQPARLRALPVVGRVCDILLAVAVLFPSARTILQPMHQQPYRTPSETSTTLFFAMVRNGSVEMAFHLACIVGRNQTVRIHLAQQT